MLDHIRRGGIYRYQGREYEVIELSTPAQSWQALGLMGHPFQQLMGDINYIRADGAIIDVNFEQTGTMAELEDTGRSADA